MSDGLSPQAQARFSPPTWVLWSHVLTPPCYFRQDEGIAALERIAPAANASAPSDATYSSPTPEEAALLQQTLICFVLVDPLGRHAFCSLYGESGSTFRHHRTKPALPAVFARPCFIRPSHGQPRCVCASHACSLDPEEIRERHATGGAPPPFALARACIHNADFGPWPLLRGINHLPQQAMELVQSARAVFVNGFIFDELRLDVVQEACQEAIQKGGAIFFDPGA